jgi:hypothetical protein
MQASSQPLRVEEIVRIITSTSAKNPPQGNAWHPRYGTGRIHALAAIRAAANLPPAGLEQSGQSGNGKRADTRSAGYQGFQDIVAALAETASRSRVRVQLDLLVEPVPGSYVRSAQVAPPVSRSRRNRPQHLTEGFTANNGFKELDFDDALLRVRQVLAKGLGVPLKNVKADDNVETKWHMDEQQKRDWKGPLEAEFQPRHGTVIDTDDLADQTFVEGFASAVFDSTPVPA